MTMRRFLSVDFYLLFLILVSGLLWSCGREAPPPVTELAPEQVASPVRQNVLPPTWTPALPTDTVIQPTATRRPKATPIPSPAVTEGQTFVFPTFTPTPFVTPTAYPSLDSAGPYLAYVRQEGGQRSIVLLDAVGRGRRVWPLPANARLQNLTTALSPDGRWLAFHLGEASSPLNNEAPATLNLSLMDLTDGSVKLVSHLLAEDYPQSFTALAEAYQAQNPGLSVSLAELAATLQWTFLEGIEALAWSPGGSLLAFASQRDGVSSDVYVYNPETGLTRRLSQSAQSVQWIGWTPDGQQVVYAEADLKQAGEYRSLHVVSSAGGSAVTVTGFGSCGGFTEIAGWRPGQRLLVYCNRGGFGFGGLQALDIRSGEAEDLFPDVFNAYTFDPFNGDLFISASFSSDPQFQLDFTPGLYRISPADGSRTLLAAGRFKRVAYWGTPWQQFVASGRLGLAAVAADGTVTTLNSRPDPPWWLSPDRNWLLAATQGEVSGALLYAADGSLYSQLAEVVPDEVAWRPDSAGVFLRAGPALYYVDIPGGTPFLVDHALLPYGGPPMAWTRGG